MKIGTHQFKVTNAQTKLRQRKLPDSFAGGFGSSILNRTGPVKIGIHGEGEKKDPDDRATEQRPKKKNVFNSIGMKAKRNAYPLHSKNSRNHSAGNKVRSDVGRPSTAPHSKFITG